MRFAAEWIDSHYDRAYLDRDPDAQVLRSDGINLLKHLVTAFRGELTD